MFRVESVRRYLAGAVALLAASALGGCAEGVGMADPPERSLRTEAHRSVSAAAERSADAPQVKAERAADAQRDGEDAPHTADRLVGASDASGADDGEASPAAIVHRPGIDLEFSAGLPEPSQEQVVAPPAPWTPSRDAEAGAMPVIDDVWPDKAPSAGGDRVVLRGKHLQVAQVVFGITPARIIEASDEKLTVAAPAENAGEVAIVVTNRDGNYAIAGTAFHFYN